MFSCLFGTITVYSFCIRMQNEYTVMVPKRHENIKFCWCNVAFPKIWTFSFPKPFREFRCDLSMIFYTFLKFGRFWLKWWFLWFLLSGKFFHGFLKIDLEVTAMFPGRFWKAENPYFTFLKKYLIFEHFCNPNGNLQDFGQKRQDATNIPFWFQIGMKN